MYWFNIFLYTIVIIPYTIAYIRRYKLSPVSVFLLMQMTFFYGICFAETGRTQTNVKLETLYVVANIAFVLGTILSQTLAKKRRVVAVPENLLHETETKSQRTVLWIIAIVAVAICTYLFVSSGVNVFLESLASFFSGTNENLQGDRTEFRGVAGMGYIYQFRVILLPLIATYFAFVSPKKYNKAVTIPLMILMIIFVLGTGQRNAFVFYCIIVVLAVVHFGSEYNIKMLSKKQIIFFGATALLFLVALTISNGRVDNESEGNIIVGALQSLYDRFFGVNQGSAMTAFRYIDSQETVWGYDWLQMLKQALPGDSDYIAVDNIAYYMDYGTYKGTNPPCLWGSAWYNFNFLGVTLFPFLLGIIYHNVYVNYHAHKEKTRMYVLLYVALCVYLGIWSYGTPMTLINNGVITVLLLRWLLYSVFSRKKERSYEGMIK